MMIVPIYYGLRHPGYFAGTGDGVVKIKGKPASRAVYALDYDTLRPVQRGACLDNGHYLIPGLDPNKRYVILARDHVYRLPPVGHDAVRPSNDLTPSEQRELWQSWQNE